MSSPVSRLNLSADHINCEWHRVLTDAYNNPQQGLKALTEVVADIPVFIINCTKENSLLDLPDTDPENINKVAHEVADYCKATFKHQTFLQQLRVDSRAARDKLKLQIQGLNENNLSAAIGSAAAKASLKISHERIDEIATKCDELKNLESEMNANCNNLNSVTNELYKKMINKLGLGLGWGESLIGSASFRDLYFTKHAEAAAKAKALAEATAEASAQGVVEAAPAQPVVEAAPAQGVVEAAPAQPVVEEDPVVAAAPAVEGAAEAVVDEAIAEALATAPKAEPTPPAHPRKRISLSTSVRKKAPQRNYA